MMPANDIPGNFPSVDCGSPGNPRNGSLEGYTVTSEGSEVFYSCNQGVVPVMTAWQHWWRRLEKSRWEMASSCGTL